MQKKWPKIIMKIIAPVTHANEKTVLTTMKYVKYFIIFAVSIIGLPFCLGWATSQFEKKEGIITVDCSTSAIPVKSMVGFLHSFNDTAPSQKLIDELAPKYWRVGHGLSTKYKNSSLKQIRGRKISSIVILSDFYNPIGKTKWLPPNQNMHGYIALIDETYLRYGNNVIYDIWNEPNHPDFWKQSEGEYLTAFKVAHDRIRSLPGGDSAWITGPSISYFDKAFIERFLLFCSQNNIKLDILSWHDFRTGKKIQQMRQDIKWARENWLKQYKSIGIKEIHINEIIGQGDQYSPLISLMFFKALEEGGADGACKACWWNNSKSLSNCYNNSLDGLIDNNGRPRSIWWAYKYYNMSTRTRIISTTNSEDLISFAFIEDNGMLKSIDILLGINQSFDSPIILELESIKKLQGFNNKKNITVECYEIPDTNEDALDSIVLKSVQKVSIIKDGRLSVVFNNLSTKKVYILKVHP